MPLSGHLKAGLTIIVSGALAVSAPLVLPGSQPTPSVRCGGLNYHGTIDAPWEGFKPYAQTDRLWDYKGSPVGLFTARYGGQDVGLFSLYIDGDLGDVQDFVPVDPAGVFNKDKDALFRVQQIQKYLSSNWLAYEPNDSNTQASQLALWSVVHDYDYTQNLVETGEDRAAWEKFIMDEIAAIRSSGTDHPVAPYSIDVRLNDRQWRGFISLTASASSLDGQPVSGLKITARTPGTSKSAITDAKGKAVLGLADPAPGWEQTVNVEWRSTLPAGTLLKAVYPEKHKLEKGVEQGYVLTGQPVTVSAEAPVPLSDGWCQP